MFQSTMNTTTIRDEVKEGIGTWTQETIVQIDGIIFLMKAPLDNMAAGRFSPVGVITQYELAGQGIILLLCLPANCGSMEQALVDEDIEGNNGVLKRRAKERQRQKIQTGKPPKNYYEVTEIVSTFAVLLFELFGKFCGLYVDALTLSNVLASELVKKIKNSSTKTAAQSSSGNW